MRLMLGVLAVGTLVLLGCGVSFDLGGFGESIAGSGTIISESRPVSDFTQINLLGSGVLIITQGDHYALEVETDDNLMEYIKTEVQGDTLELGFTSAALDNRLRPTDGFVFRVTVQELEGLEVAGSGTINAESLDCDMLVVTLAGSGEVRIGNLVAGDLTVQIIGSGDIGIEGEAERQSYLIAGSGSIDTGDLRGDAVTVTIPGSGSATVWAMRTLHVSIAGSGSVEYYGSPSVTQSILGSGSVSGLGDK